MARAAPTTIRGGYGRGVTTIRKIVEFSGGDALASTDASEPRTHDRRYAGCQGGLGRGRGVFGPPRLHSCIAWETQRVTMMEIASSSQWKNAWSLEKRTTKTSCEGTKNSCGRLTLGEIIFGCAPRVVLPPQQPASNATMEQLKRWGEDVSNDGLDAFYAH